MPLSQNEDEFRPLGIVLQITPVRPLRNPENIFGGVCALRIGGLPEFFLEAERPAVVFRGSTLQNATTQIVAAFLIQIVRTGFAPDQFHSQP